ncbi:acyltransferase family protein [Neomicrococcus lactis]
MTRDSQGIEKKLANQKLERRFTELDGLRGIAALAVVGSHYTGAHNSRYVSDPPPFYDFTYGAFGVQLFFLISGFVILMSATRAKRPTDFIISRVSRLYPAYWISLALAVLVIKTFNLPPHNPGFLEILANTTMVQRWLLIPNVEDVYWTLAIEMQFYVLILVLLLVTRCNIKDRLVVAGSSIWLAVSVAVSVWAGPSSRGINPQLVDTPVKIILNISLAEFGPLFCAGMLLYISRRNSILHPMAIVAGLVAAINAAVLHDLQSGGIVLGIFLVFLLVTMRKETKILNIAPLQWYGKISYSLYITHATLGYVVIHFVWPYVGRTGAMIVALVVASLVAWGVYKFGEVYLSGKLKALMQSAQRKWLVSK